MLPFLFGHRKKESGLRKWQSFCLDGAMLAEPQVRSVAAPENSETMAANDERFINRHNSKSFSLNCLLA